MLFPCRFARESNWPVWTAKYRRLSPFNVYEGETDCSFAHAAGRLKFASAPSGSCPGSWRGDRLSEAVDFACLRAGGASIEDELETEHQREDEQAEQARLP